MLHRSGAEVFSARAEAALVLLDSQYFDLVVLCHTLSTRDIVRICRLVKLFWPRSRMLMVSKIGDTHMQTCDPDIVFPWRTGPQALLELTRDLLADRLAPANVSTGALAFLLSPVINQQHRALLHG